MKYNNNAFLKYIEVLLYLRWEDQIRIDSIEFLYYLEIFYKLEMIFFIFQIHAIFSI